MNIIKVLAHYKFKFKFIFSPQKGGRVGSIVEVKIGVLIIYILDWCIKPIL